MIIVIIVIHIIIIGNMIVISSIGRLSAAGSLEGVLAPAVSALATERQAANERT